MNDIVFYALLATLGTWLVTALGAATVVLFKSPNPKILNLMLGFAAGVMVAASFWSLLQPAIERAEAAGSMPAFLVATLGFLCGALFMWGSDKCVTYAQRRSALAQGVALRHQIGVFAEHDEDANGGGDGLRADRCNGDTRNAHVETDDADEVEDNIQNGAQNEEIQRCFTVAECAQDRCRGVIRKLCDAAAAYNLNV